MCNSYRYALTSVMEQSAGRAYGHSRIYWPSQMQCALDVSVISGKLEVQPIISLRYFFLSKDVTLQIFNFISVS